MKYSEIYKAARHYIKTKFDFDFSINGLLSFREAVVDHPIDRLEIDLMFDKDSLSICMFFLFDGRKQPYKTYHIDGEDMFKDLSREDEEKLVNAIYKDILYQLRLYSIDPFIIEKEIFDSADGKIEHTEAITKIKKL